ncbi:MAG: hypothetical protein ACAI25_18890 [Planctomycetota bacterium]
MTLRFSIAAVACACLLARPAYANGDGEAMDEPPQKTQSTAPPVSSSDDDAGMAVKLPNTLGLSGFGDMIDARIPTGLTIRGGVRLEQQKSELKGPLMEFKSEQLNMQAYAGVAVLELFEVGARLPFEFNRTSKGVKVNGGSTRKGDDNFGDLDLGAKLSIRLGPVALAPYAVITIPSGDRRFVKDAGGRVGGAVTVAILKSILNFHGNLDAQWAEGNHWAINYRTGVSFVPLATKLLLLRPYIFLDGKQALANESGADLRVAAGAQALLFDFITVEAGGAYRFFTQATPSELDHDEGTWSFHVGAGVAF